MTDSVETAVQTADNDKPLLSIGIIFRNDIRSIERCLKALQPLRDAIPCQLVMGDTGAMDGSRAVADRYADIVFDFPWIDDFAAARNAVVDKCTGEWCLTVDTDEYLDEDFTELTDFLKSGGGDVIACHVNIRNYSSYEMNDSYSDFYALRLVRMSSGARYKGAIHESWSGFKTNGAGKTLNKTIFHHDGYVNMAANPAKLERNMSLLRKKLHSDQRNLLIRLQIIESGFQEPDHVEQLRKAVALVRRKSPGWETFGPPIFRHAVSIARSKNLPELEKWTEQALKWFPNSYYTRIDVANHRMLMAAEKKNYDECIRLGEDLLEAYADYFAGQGEMGGLAASTMQFASPYHERNARMILANAYLETGQPEKALPLMEGIDCRVLDQQQTNNFSNNLCLLHSRSDLDTSKLVRDAWEGLTNPKPSKEQADNRRITFLLVGSIAFSEGLIRTEKQHRYFRRPAYTLFLPLVKICPLGTAAAMLETDDPLELALLLATVEKWGELSTPALVHALECGMPFPLPDRPMNMEEMDGLASRLAQQDKTAIMRLAQSAVDTVANASWQRLNWTRSLGLAAVQNFNWKAADAERGMAGARTFARIEGAYLPRCYTPEVLQEANLSSLSPMHRFGWYCVQAFEALDAGNPADYARFLREGLVSCEPMKPMVEFLLDHTPEFQAPPPSPELLELASQVRVLLARYDPNDPAVVALKNSPTYQKVAHLLEDRPLPPPMHKSPGNNPQIFTFWEPRNSIPPYIQLCMKTWKKFIPHAEIHVLDYSNMANYVDVEGIYGKQLFSGNFTLPMIADAIRALVLEQHGGVWMDADTILTGENIEEYLQSKKEVSFWGYPSRPSVHLAWISAKKHARILQYWVSECARKINALTEEAMADQDFWSYLGNSIVNPYIQAHPDEIEIIDVMKTGCIPERKDISENPYSAYIDFYFKKSLHLKDIDSPVLLLHNSWTPPQYKTLQMDQLPQFDCTMSNILMELTR